MNDTLQILLLALAGACLILLVVFLLRRGKSDALRSEMAEQLNASNRLSLETMSRVSESTAQNLENMRLTLERQLQSMRLENERSVEKIRATVDTELSKTLSENLNNSFKTVSAQLGQVINNMGEMRSMASDISGLKNVLANVKNRGTWGEVQLGAIIEDLFSPAQYEKQFAVAEGRERVDYAIRLPGQEQPVYLPIDAKFPLDRYGALMTAENSGDPAAVAAAKGAFIKEVAEEARSIRKKYIAPPTTTDFAVLFVPSEGMYATLAAADMTFTLQHNEKVLLAGPSTLAAMLNSLQMGFSTLAIEKRSAEIMELLGAVRAAFGRFGENLAATRKSLTAAANNLNTVEQNSRGIVQRLKRVQEMEEPAARALLGEEYFEEEQERPL